MADENHPAHLSPSELGTKDYWETFYARTLAHISIKHDSNTSSTAVPKDNNASFASDECATDDEIDDDSDPGTSWFSEHNAPDKVLQFLTDEAFPLAPCHTRRLETSEADDDDAQTQSYRSSTSASASTGVSSPQSHSHSQPCILDLGTGNGSMLALLRKRGKFTGDMVGVDYSPRSVELARELQRLRIHSAYLSDSDSEADSDGEDGSEGDKTDTNIRFEEWDILQSTDALSGGDHEINRGERGERRLDWFPYDKGGFDIVLDKGTFDAVSLSEEVVEEDNGIGDGNGNSLTNRKKVQRRVCECYPHIARRLVRKGGFLVVTSCNWTEEELIQWFTRKDESSGSSEDRLQVWGKVEYPRFRFGGKEGQGVCTVCFQRV
ncbi:hypothetical protein EYZ11_011936 [Aspergillus tanneri]|uniref:Protein-lysine N-methyltransferase EFM4 n=1 Tax=Aspergillus tanneri TaxID=1220188 RepID=A0A4S3J1T4_9EURO|nr:uncharacterized protein ATNIH1004_005960 [Aspergillus tanneri]KAA8647270.1 hypothetical protein ATNIH1004_005960 [Aspergillus tanneri]THC88615.1 hypothetical protein EYZ11_011936 [Aspergillus tanneri]